MKFTSVGRTLLGLLLGWGCVAAAAETDRALLAAAQAAQPAVIESLRAMVAIESGSMDGPGLLRMADYAQERLKALGAQVERRKASSGNGDILIGRFSGSGKRGHKQHGGARSRRCRST